MSASAQRILLDGEALQRVPGIALNRDEFTGEGSGVSVRGLNQITTSLAGRSIFSGVGRSLNLGEVPAGLVGRVDVYKSPQADQIEAGLGGTVDVKLRSPADLKKFTASVTARGIYRRLSDAVNPSFSALVGDNFDVGDGKLGLLVAGIYDRRNFRTDRMAIDAFADRRNLVDRSGDGRTNNNNPLDSIYVPATLTTRYSEGEFERKAIGGRLQYKVRNQYEFYLDGIYNSYNGIQTHSFIAPRFNQRLFGVQATLPSFTVRPDNYTLETGTFRNVPTRVTTYSFDENNTVWQGAAGFKIHVGKFTFAGDTSLLKSTKDALRRDLTRGVIVPNYYIDLRPETPFYDFQNIDLLDPSNYRPASIYTTNYPNKGQEWATRFDASAKLNLPFLRKLSWGFRLTRRTADRIGFDETVSVEGRTPTTPLANFLEPTPDDLFDNKFDLTDRVWLRPSPDKVRDFPALLRAFGISPDFHALEPLLAYSFKESTRAMYLMGEIGQNIGQMRLTGNVGVRYVRTKQDASGFRTAPETGAFEPSDIDRDYDALLPSMNLALRVNPDLVIRGAFSQVMSKPSFLDLSPTRTLDFEDFTGSGGNPSLEPYKANQYDAAIEYYFGRPGFVYLGYFRKDIDGYYQRISVPEVIDGQTFLISQLVNADGAKVSGFEFGYQQQYDFLPGILRGLGGRFSYTRIRSNRYNSVLERDEALSGLSPNQYNATLTYELGGFRARLAYNWRQTYPINLRPGGALNLPQVRQSFGIWDASATYQLRENVALFFDVANITNERGTEVFTIREQPRSFFLSDQPFGFGIRANF
jgi:TonB-dependent receptor